MNREKTIIRTSLIGIGANILLVAFKAFIGFLVGSIAIILDAVNNLTDALSSGITIVGTKLANRKPDAKHPYGHGRIEYITSLAISIIILFAGVTAIYQSVGAIIENKDITYTIPAIVIVSAAIVVKLGLGIYFRHVGKKINSEALKASGTDAMFDAIISVGTLVAILVSMLWSVNIEGYLGVAIGLFIIKAGIEVLHTAISSIIGERTSKETSLGIKAMVCSSPLVKGAYDLIINNYGPQRAYGSVHIEVDDGLTAREIHALTRSITEEVYFKYGVILTVGVYASNTSSEEIAEIKSFLLEEIKKYPDIKQFHGFYVDKERMVITFDIIIDFKCKDPNSVRNAVFYAVKEKYPLYDYFIVLDNDITD